MAEMLSTLVPLMRDLGLDAHWMVLDGDDDFFKTTKSLHNCLQGAEIVISKAMREHYLEVNHRNAADVEDGWDYIVVHDPQPASLIKELEIEGKWIWRSHIQLTNANSKCMDFLGRFLPEYDASIYSLEEYFPSTLNLKNPVVIHPSIDPLSPKNRPVAPEEIRSIAEQYGVDPDRPSICCVARFDPWKDPLGTIDVYREIRKRVEGLQLLFITAMALDDPEGWEYYEKTMEKADGDPNIKFLTDEHGIDSVHVNAFQRCSEVSMLKSLREGFGLVVAEALWKRAPVVAWKSGGIPLQVIDGKTGYLAEEVATLIDRTIRLFEDEGLRRRMGEAGRAHVRKNFLITRHLKDYLDLFLQLSHGGSNK